MRLILYFWALTLVQLSAGQLQTTNSTTGPIRQDPIEQNSTITNATIPLVEARTEQLVKESNLQAEESHQVASVSILPPPSSPSQLNPLDSSRPPVKFSGGSGNAYMSLSRDGSNRYEFGYDTEKNAQPEQQNPRSKSRARLMREESRLEDGTVIGRYGYMDPFNVFRIVQYVAGPDGYFATEDVGAVPAGSSQTSIHSPGGQFQLNKQLHKALEEARKRRLRNEASEHHDTLQSSASSKSTRTSNKQPAETLSESGSHQAVRYATKINHVIGTNGISYATAFRPVAIERQMSFAKRMPTYEPVRSPDPLELLKQQTNKLRSKLPAPIYTPNSVAFTTQIDHSSQIASEPQIETIVGTSNQQPTTLQASSWSWSKPIDHQTMPTYPASMNVLQASPAWSVLNNNYNDQLHHSTVVIDHSDTNGHNPLAANQFAPQVGENFEREAAILRSLRGNSQAQVQVQSPPQPQQQLPQPQRYSPMTFGMAYAGSSPRVASDASFRQRSSIKPSVYGMRTGSENHWTSSGTQAPPTGYNFAGLALQNFDPPLYHPEVHQTNSNDAVSADSSKPVVYSSTILHSEVAAERDYRPERLRLVAQSGTELLQSGASEQHNATISQPNRQATVAQESQTINEPLKYATRLSAVNRVVSSDQTGDDMYMDDSEQVAYMSSANGTVSRAKLPDRSKKLSSIFKARTSGEDQSQSAHGIARIRRPIPVNAKKHNQPKTEQLASNKPEDANQAVAVEEQSPKVQDETSRAQQQQQHQPAKSFSSGKKFGRLNGSIERSQELQIEQEPTVSGARKRPTLREPKRQDVVIEAIPSPDAKHTTTEQTSSVGEWIPIATAPVSTNNATRSPNLSELPTATIIDATNQSNESMKSALDKNLYEKIVKIQQEIARMNRMSSVTSTSTSTETSTISTSSTTTQPPQTTTSSTTTTTTSTPAPTSTESPETTTTATTSTSTSRPNIILTSSDDSVAPVFRDTSVTTTLKPEVQTQAQQSTSESSVVVMPKSLFIGSPARKSAFGSTTTSTPEPVTAARNVLSGPLAKMEALVSSDDIFERLSMDMDAFDSTRADVISKDLSGTKQENAVTPVSSTTTTTTFAPTSSPPTKQTINNPDQESGFSRATLRLPTTVPPTTTTNNPKLNQGPKLEINETVKVFETATESNLAYGSTTNLTTIAPPPAPPLIRATTTTTTTTSAPIIETSTFKPLRRTTVPPRFGRLVIKRGDKVVARYNGTEPIPDSMIPVGGTGAEIIMPDMPRLGAKRAIKRTRINQTASAKLIATSTTTQAPSTTEAAKIVPTTSVASTKPDTTTATTVTPVNTTTTITTRLPTIANTTSDLNQINSSLPVASQIQTEANSTTAAPLATTISPPIQESGNITRLISTSVAGSLANATQSTGLSRSRKRSLSRGIRSHGGSLGEDEGDLMFSETQRDVVSEGRDIATGRSSTVRPNARNWSSRLRESPVSSRPQPSDKLYDPKEDLRKLVEKITTIESGLPSTTLAPASSHTVDKLEEVRERENLRLSQALGHQDITRRPVTTVPTQGDQIVIANESNLEANSSQSIKPVELSRVVQSTTTTTTTAPMTTTPTMTSSEATTMSQLDASLSNLVQSVRSQILDVASGNSTSNSSNISSLITNENSGHLKLLPGNITLETPHTKSESKSVAFTVTLSPDIEKQWTKMKPLTELVGQQLAATSNSTLIPKLLNSTNKPQEIRVDSRGYIHVRNNQSITVFVDIEPPKKNPLANNISQTITSPTLINTLNLNSTNTTNPPAQRRLSNRDTLAVMNFGSSDLQRLSSSSLASRKSKTTNSESLRASRSIRSEPVDINRPPTINGNSNLRDLIEIAASDKKKVELSSAANQGPKRMLCVEVEAGSSNNKAPIK